MSDPITYKTDDKTAIFDFVVTKLIEQGGPALNESGMCRYRAEVDGEKRKCALGWLIPDSEYDAGLEGNSLTLDGTVASHKDCSIDIPKQNVDFIRNLQLAHDNLGCRNGNEWNTEKFKFLLGHIALTYGLATYVFRNAGL